MRWEIKNIKSMQHLCASAEEHNAGHRSDAVQPRYPGDVVKFVPDVVLQEPYSRFLPPSLGTVTPCLSANAVEAAAAELPLH